MPIYSKTLIGNMALANCGITGRLQDIDNENTNEAINLRLFYDHVLAMILESRPWPFVTRKLVLASLGNPPAEWAFRYKYPSNCRYIHGIINPRDRTPLPKDKIPYVVQDIDDGYGKCIMTDMEGATILFNLDDTDVSKFTAAFVEAFALGLSSHIAMPLRVDANVQAGLSSKFTGWLAEAANLAQREQQDEQEPESEYVDVRS